MKRIVEEEKFLLNYSDLIFSKRLCVQMIFYAKQMKV